MKTRCAFFSLLGLVAVLCIALPVRAALPYPTASTVGQLYDDLNYANTNGGTFTINLQPNTGFTNGVEGTFDIGSLSGTITVHLTIIGNGDTFNSNYFLVFPGSSLTLEQMTLQNGYAVGGGDRGAILNDGGTVTISNCTLSIVVFRPNPSNGWSLQQNSDLTTANWVTSTNTVANGGTNNFITPSPSSDKLFFRLKY